MKQALNIRTVLSRDAVQVTGAEQIVYALVDIQAADRSLSGSMPANISLVLDRSGSMDGAKMERLKEAVGGVLDHLNERDRLSVTVFDDTVETIVPGQAVRDRDGIRAALEKVIARGGTQISDGLKAGLEEARKDASADRVNRVLLITDGQTWDDESACLALAEEAGKEGIAITSIGIGEDWNEKLLLRIAERSRGDSHWIEDPAVMPGLFRQELDSAQTVAATNLSVAMQVRTGVRPVRVFATVPMIAEISSRTIVNGSIQADLGTLNGRKGQTLLFEMSVSPQKEGPYRLGQVDVTYDIPSRGIRSGRLRRDLTVRFTADAAAAEKVNAEVMNLVERVTAFKLQTRALAAVEAGDLDTATRRLQSAATVLLGFGEEDLASAAIREAHELKRTGTLTSAGTKKLEYGTRKLTQVLK